jgi:hypothetical protein
MLKLLFVVLLLASLNVFSNPSGAGTCVVNFDYASIPESAMMTRRRNLTNVPYVVTTNANFYSAGNPVEITISGPDFIGIMFTLVDETGQNVGTFAPDNNIIHDCSGANPTSPPSAAVTHASGFNMTSYTLFWLPPASNAGKVYILGYVLKGSIGNISTQEFFRFVRDDLSAVSLNARDVFTNGFE